MNCYICKRPIESNQSRVCGWIDGGSHYIHRKCGAKATEKPTPFGLLERLVMWWHLRQARKAAKKFNLDFEHRCCFRQQVVNIGAGLKNGNGEIVLVPMRSGKTAEYKVTSERFNMAFEDTGQRNWMFEFQGYAT